MFEVLNNIFYLKYEIFYLGVAGIKYALTYVHILELNHLQRKERGCQTLHDQFLSYSQYFCSFIGIYDKNSKGFSGKDILDHIVIIWNSLEVLPLKYILEYQDEIQQFLINSSLEVWVIDRDCLDISLYRLGPDVYLHGVFLLHQAHFQLKYWD